MIGVIECRRKKSTVKSMRNLLKTKHFTGILFHNRKEEWSDLKD